MRFENFHLYITDFSKHSWEHVLAGNAEDAVSMEVTNASDFIQNASYNLDGIGWSAINKPLSPYAKEHFLYIQSFTYYEVQTYFTKRKYLDSYQLKYTYEGEGELFYEGKTYTLGPQQGYVIDCRRPHEYHLKRGPWNHCEIHFSGSPFSYIYDQFLKDEIVSFEISENNFQIELEKLLTLHESLLPYRELQISHQLEHILLMILCHSESYQRTVYNIPENLHYLLSYMDQHYMQPLTLDYLAEFSGINKYYLCKLFQKHLGLSPKEYLLLLRIEGAKKLLLNATLPANKIGAMVGITDENYFYRLFKSKVGMSANEFRRK